MTKNQTINYNILILTLYIRMIQGFGFLYCPSKKRKRKKEVKVKVKTITDYKNLGKNKPMEEAPPFFFGAVRSLISKRKGEKNEKKKSVSLETKQERRQQHRASFFIVKSIAGMIEY